MKLASFIPRMFWNCEIQNRTERTETSWGNQNWTNIGHDWAEVYLPSQGWVWVDPVSNNYGCTDGQHIAFQIGQYCESLSGNYLYSYIGNGKITEQFKIYLQG